MDLTYDPPTTFRHSLDRLHELVAKEVGSDDFGPADYLPGLQVLLQSMDYDPNFSSNGRRVAWGQVIGALKGRVHAIESMRENPGFDRRAVASPVVITGVPRTGTTALHKLMAVDERFQGLQTWLLDTPMPRPPAHTWTSYPQFQKTAALLEARFAAAPQKRAAHSMAAEQVDECCLVLWQTFVSNLWSCGWSAPTYDAWWQCQSEAASYRHYYRCVQLIGSNEPQKRWLLKNPGHIDHLDLLFAVFPDAKVIQTHRDPAKAVPSLVSLLMQLHLLMEEGRKEQRGEIMLRREVAKWANAVRKAEQVRKHHPGKVLDVVHGDFHREPMRVLERIYAFIEMDIPEHTRKALAQRIEEKPELQHGVHRYDIADYGMNEAEVREAFGEYVQRYDLLETRDGRSHRPAGSVRHPRVQCGPYDHQSPEDTAMTHPTHAIVRTFFAHLSKGELPDELTTPDMTTWTTSAGSATKERFRAGIKVLQSLFPHGLLYTIDAITAEEDRAAAEVQARGTLVNGEDFHNIYVFIFRLRDGKISGVWEHNNPDPVREKLGPLFKAAMAKAEH